MFQVNSIRTKMILIFLPLTLLSTLLLTFSSYWLFSTRMSGILISNVNETVDQASRHTDTYLEEFIRLSVLPYYNPDILSILETNQPIDGEQYKTIQKLLSNAISNPREDLQGVFIYREDGQVFSGALYQPNINYNYRFRTSSWYQKTIAHKGKAVFFGENDDLRVLNRPNPAFSVARTIQLYDGPVLGTILIDVNYRKLEELFEKVDLGAGSNLVVYSDDGKIIYSKNSLYLDSLATLLSAENSDGTASGQFKIGKEEVVAGSAVSPLTGWRVVGVVPKTELNQSIIVVRNVIILISGLLTLAVAVSCIWISHTITKPLRELKSLMGEVAKGNYSVSFRTLGVDEVSDVGRAFNKMSRQINDLVNQVLMVRYKQKEAELNNLKLQIRPHFLYNNLESIRALAELEDKKGIIEITAALGSMLRYSINKQNSMVKLAEEMNQVQNYLKIEQIRSGHALNIELEVEPDILDCLVVPIILQPIVENSIQHGFSSKKPGKTIRIRAWSRGNQMVIEVWDNGSGISDEAKEQIRLHLADETGEEETPYLKSGIGLKNVHTRLRLTYGSDYGLEINSGEGAGTTVRLILPYYKNPTIQNE